MTPLSQRVNALFASYVANEREQDRLGRAGDDAGAQALCAPTIAIREQVFAIRDRTGCADLIAARLLLDLMLVTRWNDDGGPQIGFEDQETVLPLLETLADSTTGAVRQQTAKALATIGVHVAPESPDPMLALVSDYRRLHESLSSIPDDDEANQRWAEVLAPLWDRLTQAPPAPTTNAGAAAAIRLVRDESRGSYAPDLIAGVLTATADALAERAGAINTQPDPLALLLADYREALDAHNAADLPDDDVAEEAHAAATYRPLYERIETDCPTPTTLAGVREAVRLALNREMGDAMPAFAESLLRAALAHLEGRG